MEHLSELIKERLDVFLEDLLRAAGNLSPAASSPAAKINIFDTVDQMIRSRRNEHTCFNQLPASIIHRIFGTTLNLDRIHDYDLPLEDLEEHRRNLFNMRRVSAAWNAFLVSRPEYWCAIDITTTAPESILARAQQAPLCLYSKQGPKTDSTPPFEYFSSAFSGHTTQVRTLRSDRKDAYDFKIRTLRAGLPDLETLELTKETDRENMDEEFPPENIGDQLPRIRHLTTVGWQPSADASWLQNLQVLILKPPLKFNLNLLRVLSACRNLSKLALHADNGPESAEEMADAPSQIDLPCLQEVGIEVDMSLDASYIVPALRLPSRSRRFLRIVYAMSFELSPNDISQFLYTPADGLAPPQEAAIKFYRKSGLEPRVAYTLDRAGLDLHPGPLTGWAYDGFPALMQAVQAHMKDPPLSVTLSDIDKNDLYTLERLADLNITKIWVNCREADAVRSEDVMDLLGSRYPVLPFDAAKDEEWPFESLGELTIEGTSLDLNYLTKMIEIRQQYLRKFSKTWLRKITLVGCPLYGGTGTEEVALKLAAMGVKLVISDSNSG